MISSELLNSLGLVLDIIGAVILFFFGLTPKIDTEGTVYLIAEQKDEDEIKRGKFYKIMSSIGIGLIAVGFIFQLISNNM